MIYIERIFFNRQDTNCKIYELRKGEIFVEISKQLLQVIE